MSTTWVLVPTHSLFTLVTAAYVVRNETIFYYIKYKRVYSLKQFQENFASKIRSMCNKQRLQTNIKLKDFEEKI